jgi:muramidase (phage lysozyme)
MADVKGPSGLDDPSHILDGINPDGLLGGIDLSAIGASSGLDLLMDRADLGQADSDIEAMAVGDPHLPPAPDYKVEAPDPGAFHFYPDRLETDHALLGEPHVQALMTTIRGREGPAYNVIHGGQTFDDYSQHPNSKVNGSTAAGAYQINHPTWMEQKNAMNLPDFTPASQDLAAVDLLRRLHSTDRLLSGDLDGAIFSAAQRWQSLPTTERQRMDAQGRVRGVNHPAGGRETPTNTLDQIRADYLKNMR